MQWPAFSWSVRALLIRYLWALALACWVKGRCSGWWHSLLDQTRLGSPEPSFQPGCDLSSLSVAAMQSLHGPVFPRILLSPFGENPRPYCLTTLDTWASSSSSAFDVWVLDLLSARILLGEFSKNPLPLIAPLSNFPATESLPVLLAVNPQMSLLYPELISLLCYNTPVAIILGKVFQLL